MYADRLEPIYLFTELYGSKSAAFPPRYGRGRNLKNGVRFSVPIAFCGERNVYAWDAGRCGISLVGRVCVREAVYSAPMVPSAEGSAA